MSPLIDQAAYRFNTELELSDDEKIDFSSYKKEIENSLKKSDTLLYVGYDGKLLGTIGLSDELRENTKESIKRLKMIWKDLKKFFAMKKMKIFEKWPKWNLLS